MLRRIPGAGHGRSVVTRGTVASGLPTLAGETTCGFVCGDLPGGSAVRGLPLRLRRVMHSMRD